MNNTDTPATSKIDYGRCLPECLSYITKVPLNEIPHFCWIYEQGEWVYRVYEWLKKRGFFGVFVSMEEAGKVCRFPDGELCVLTGRPKDDKAGLHHAVVAKVDPLPVPMEEDMHPTFQVVYDPGSLPSSYYIAVDVLFVVKRCP